jgi:tetratricopeptide (TPR) repeat protein
MGSSNRAMSATDARRPAAAAADGPRWHSIGERLAARARDRWAWISRPAGGRSHGWHLRRWCIAASVVLLVLAAAAVVLTRRPVELPSAQDLDRWRDFLVALVEVVVLLMALGLLLTVLWWLSRPEPAVICPFANATTSPGLTAVSDLLAGHLDRIAKVQNTPIADIPGERLRTDPIQPMPETVDSSLANVGSINVGQATISIGQLLIALKRMLRVGSAGTAISGSVQRYGKRVQIVAIVRRSHQSDAVMVSGETAGDDEPILELVPDLAYRIHFALAGPRMAAGTWELLKCFTEARAAYQRYIGGGRSEDRGRAVELTRQAYAMDCTYPRLFGLLYGLGTCFFGTGEFHAAIDLFRSALNVVPRTPQALIQLARCHYALQEDGEALRVLQQVVQQPRSHPMAVYMLGLVHGTTGDHREALEELLRVPRHPRPLRSSAWVTLAGLCLQDGDRTGHRAALRNVARHDFETDAYSRACWLSVEQDPGAAIDSLREALCRRLMPVEYALRDPDLVFIRDRCSFGRLLDPTCSPAPALQD